MICKMEEEIGKLRTEIEELGEMIQKKDKEVEEFEAQYDKLKRTTSKTGKELKSQKDLNKLFAKIFSEKEEKYEYDEEEDEDVAKRISEAEKAIKSLELDKKMIKHKFEQQNHRTTKLERT